MLRTALRPRWLALLALALVLASAFAALGSWQLGRSRDQAGDEPVPTGTVRLQELVEPQTAFTGALLGRTVEVTGELGAPTLRVEGRALDGERGAWVLNPMVVSTGDATATLPVVRGWVPDGARAPAPPSGEVTLTGRLEPSEAPTGETPSTAGASTVVSSVSSADLLNRWGQPIYTGFLVTDVPVPADGLTAIPPAPVDDRGFALQNVSYALQWWVFALFAVFIWWRLVRDAHLSETSRLEDDDALVDDEGQTEPDDVRARRGVTT